MLMFAASSQSIFTVAFIAGGIVLMLLIFLGVLLKRYTKVGPNEALIIAGRKNTYLSTMGKKDTRGFRIVKGGGTFIWPIFERADILSLEVLTLDVRLPEVYTITGVPIVVEGVAQIKVRGDDNSIATAAEQFLGKTSSEIMRVALQTVEGHLRAIVGTLTVEEIYKNRDVFAQKVQEQAVSDMANMGLMIVSFTLRDIKDNQGYLEALGRPRLAEVKKNAIIAEAEADRDATIKSAEATQAGQEAKFLAETKIAEAEKEYEVKKSEYLYDINQKKANADLAYDLQRYKTNQQVKAEEVQVNIIEKNKQIELQEKEIARKEKELEATIEKPADAEKYRIETLANAEKFKLMTEAEGKSDATRKLGAGEADSEKAIGLAKADIIKAQGHSEAEAMNKKAEAWKAYNEAAVTQLIIEKLPEIARAISEPLSKTEKMVIINSGQGGGASKVTNDIAEIIAQLPPVVESLSGIDIKTLIEKIPELKNKKNE